MTTTPVFDAYSPTELRQVAQAFVDAFKDDLDKDLGTERWTEDVLNWFAKSRRKHATIDARRDRGGLDRKTTGEFLFDLVHSSQPGYDDDDAKWGKKAYWKRALDGKQAPELFLVPESEREHAKNAEANLHAVLEDADKLLHVQARAKVVLFASVCEDNRSEIIDLLEKLVGAETTKASWLFIDMPWDGRDAGSWVLPES